MTGAERPNLYADLGLTREASRAEIARAYRTVLRRHHPDTRTQENHETPNSPANAAFPGSVAATSNVSPLSDEILNRAAAAYAVLGDPDRRAAYDRRHQHPGQSRGPAGPEQASPTTAAQPAPPASWPATRSRGPNPGAVGGSFWAGQPAIQVGPVRWHRPRRGTE